MSGVRPNDTARPAPPPAPPRRPGAAQGTWTPRRRAWYDLARFASRVALFLLYRLRATGAEHVPREGPVLLVANHQSYLDPPVIGGSLPHRRIDFLARRGLWNHRILGRMIDGWCAIPIDEDGGDVGAIREILRRLEHGHATLVFPEGSRTPDGSLHEFKRGIAVLVKRAACPVVPVAVNGCFEAWPRHAKRPRLGGVRLRVAFGPAIPHAELLAAGGDAALRRLSDEVRRLLDEG